MRIAALVAVSLLAITPLFAQVDQTLVTFEGAIGVEPISSAPGTTLIAASVIRNIVRGVQPGAQPWRIADFTAEVTADGHITAHGHGLVFAGGDTVGTALVLTPTGGTADLSVFATLICENIAPFIERNSNPVPLAANGDFKIDAVLSPPPPSSCTTPVLLIRNEANRNWFAAGIQKLDAAH
jgi:hypothetical protein